MSGEAKLCIFHLRCMSFTYATERRRTIKFRESVAPSKRKMPFFRTVLHGALDLFTVERTAFTVKSMAFQTGLMNTQETADCILQIQVVSAFTLTQGTNNGMCHLDFSHRWDPKLSVQSNLSPATCIS